MISHIGKPKGVIFDMDYCVDLFLYNLSNYRLGQSLLLVMDKLFKIIILNLRLRIAFFLERGKLCLVK